jgi:hypothetical protein
MQEEQRRIIIGTTEAEIAQQLTADLTGDEDLVYYEAEIDQAGFETLLIIDIDLGGGFESGYATTSFTAPVPVPDNFRLAIHKEGFLDSAGKLFGMQDVVLGYPDFDERFIIKTNDEVKVKALFGDEGVRTTLLSIPHFLLHIGHREIEGIKRNLLELEIEEGITDPATLLGIYHAFFNLLKKISGPLSPGEESLSNPSGGELGSNHLPSSNSL